jgi:hypothetical protein
MKYWVINIVTNLLTFFIKKSPPKVSNKLLSDILKKEGEYSNCYASVYYRDKETQKWPVLTPTIELCAIVIQGPLVLEEQFTLNTVIQYKKYYPKHKIIVSTWEGSETNQLYEIEKAGAHVVISPLPDFGGPKNINYQLISTKAGLKKAIDLNAKYVIKTRSDHRFNSPEIFHYLRGIQKTFPIAVNVKLNERIVACSMTTLKYRPYGLGDMFLFGEINDMIKFWDTPLDNRLIDPDSLSDISILHYAKQKLAETYLCSSFIERLDNELKWTIADTWKYYKDVFCVINYEDIDLFWYKYNWQNESRFMYNSAHSFDLFRFADWLVLHSQHIITPDERILNQKEGKHL